jgi:hypothetical protein
MLSIYGRSRRRHLMQVSPGCVVQRVRRSAWILSDHGNRHPGSIGPIGCSFWIGHQVWPDNRCAFDLIQRKA